MLKRIKIGDLIKQKKAHSQTGPFGTQLKASDYVEEGIPVINVRNIGFGEIRENQLEYLDDEMAKILKSHRLIENDIVFGRKGAVERHSLISLNQEGWIQGSDCIRLRFLNDEYNAKFISYFFRTESHKQWMTNLGSFGATMGSLNQDIISRIEIPNVPLTIQQKIASILSTYDELIENNKQRIRLLEEMAEEIYKEWFVRMRFPGYETAKIVDGLPEGWKNGTIGDLVEFKKGKNITLDTVTDGDVPVVAGGLTPAYYHNVANTISPTITISASGANAGFVNIYYENIWVSDCSYLDTRSTKTLFFYYLILKTRQNEVFFLQKGSAQPHVYPKDIMTLKMKKPSSDLIEKFETLINPFFEEIKILSQKNQLLQETRDLLLPRLISGKLSVEHLVEEELGMVAEEKAIYKNKNHN